MYFKYKILNVEICWKTCICLVLEKKLVKTASRWQQFVIESLSHSNDSFKTAEYCRSESNDCFYEWFSESVIHPSQRFGFRFEHKRKHHIVAHRLDNQWEIAVICFAPATIVLMREFRTRKRDERVKRASAYERERDERAAANPSSGRSFRHYDIKYTHHTTQSTAKRHLANNVSVHLNMHASILNSVPAVHTTYITVLLYERYYRLKNAMAPRVFLSFSIAILS